MKRKWRNRMEYKDVSREVILEHLAVCKECPQRKFISRRFDMWFDWLDCPYDCPNDFEHYLQREEEK